MRPFRKSDRFDDTDANLELDGYGRPAAPESIREIPKRELKMRKAMNEMADELRDIQGVQGASWETKHQSGGQDNGRIETIILKVRFTENLSPDAITAMKSDISLTEYGCGVFFRAGDEPNTITIERDNMELGNASADHLTLAKQMNRVWHWAFIKRKVASLAKQTELPQAA